MVPSAATPASVSLAYPDGAVATVPFSALPAPLRDELLRQPFALPAEGVGAAEGGGAASPVPADAWDEAASLDAAGHAKYLLLEWDDGWREVRRVPSSCTGVGRYYVIERVEETGRLALTTSADYPELVEIARRPRRLRRITLGATLELAEARSAREGGKTDHFYATTPAGDALAELRAALAEAATSEGIDLAALAAAPDGTPAGDTAAEQLDRLRRRLGVRASFAQRDVLDFVAALALTITDDRAAVGRAS